MMESGYNNLKNNFTKIKDKINNKMDVIQKDECFKDWKSMAEEKQQFYFESLGGRNWEEYQTNEVEFLRLKIGFAIFGPSADVEDENMDEPQLQFKAAEQKKIIDLITEIIYKISESNVVHTAFIFVIALVNNEYAEYPVVRILNKQSNSIFFTDMLGRVYRDWNDFTSNNALPCCICCYPKNGFYSCCEDGKVDLSFNYSPESSKLKRLLRKVDTVNGIAGMGSAAVGIAALAVPLSSPVVLGSAAAGLASAVWSTCRTVSTLRDRKKHYQTLSVSDQNARACWISLATGIIGAASAGAVQYTEFIARSGLAMNRIPTLAMNTLEIGNIGIGGLSMINHIVNIVQKKECTLSDSAQLILSILFFFHASVNFVTAKAIMTEIKKKISINLEKESNIEQLNELFINFQETKKNSLIEGNTEVIKPLNIIKNKETFFQELLGIRIKSNKPMRDGLLTSNDGINTCTTNFDLIAEVTGDKLMSSTNNIMPDSMNELKIIHDINSIAKQENMVIIESELCKKLSVKTLNDFSVDGKQLFATITSEEICILHKTVEAIETNSKNNNTFQKVIMELKKMARSLSCKDLHEFILLIQNILRKYEECKLAYEALMKILEQAKTFLHRNKKQASLSEYNSYGMDTRPEEDKVGRFEQ